MKILVKVKPGSKENCVEKVGEREYILRVKARAQEGKANEAVIKLLSGYLDIAKSRITIRLGRAGRNKVVDIDTSTASRTCSSGRPLSIPSTALRMVSRRMVSSSNHSP